MSQLALFAPEVAAVPVAANAAPAGPRENYAGLNDLIACPVIEAELMEIFRARPADWLDWPAFRPVITKHGVGFALGHKLGSMERRGLIEGKVIYLGRGIGANHPGSPDYQGFRTEYRLVNLPYEHDIGGAYGF